MSVQNRKELSEKNKYHISGHKFYELVHFCLQYNDYVKEVKDMDDGYYSNLIYSVSKGSYYSNPVEKAVIHRENLLEKIELIEQTAKETSKELEPYILKSVTTEVILPNGKVMMAGYDWMKTHMDIPCGKDMFYELRHKFFWLLRQKK